MKKHIAEKQPTSFTFIKENLSKVQEIMAKYPQGKQRSAVMPLLDMAQEQMGGWISTAVMSYIANILKMPAIEVYEVASFYSMYNLAPVGKYLVQVCRTTPCWLCDSDNVLLACKEFLEIEVGYTTKDQLFTLIEVECLGACINAPVVQINKDYYENLDEGKIIEILSILRQNG